MSTGAPIYLVSACASAEEFVAAFRRYTDRTGVFVPMAEPLPAGRTGHFALTLTDGGVMIDGEAQVAQAWPKGGGLHGRPGMTLKFLVLDDASKTVLGELEQARLAMKPRPPSVPARPATIPATPRATLPALGGRIDASNARAECVAIGDLATMRDTGSTTGPQAPISDGGRGPGKFAIPSIPNVGRPRTPSTAPELARPKSPTAPPEIAKAAPAPAVVFVPDRPTAVGPPLVFKPPADVGRSEPATSSTASDDAAFVHDRPIDAGASAPASEPVTVPGKKKMTSIGFPVVERIPAKTEHRAATSLGVAPLKVTQTQPLPLAPTPKTGPLAPDANPSHTPSPSEVASTSKPAPAARRSHAPSTPPPSGLRNPTPVAPLPITRAPAQSAPAIPDHEAERTDLSAIPLTPALEDSGATAVGAAPEEAPPSESGKVSATAAAPVKRAGGMRASEILAAIPDEDWTMTPDAAAPTVLSAAKAEPVAVAVEASAPAKGPPTGDWTMSTDPEKPGGWTEPAKVEPPRTVASGNPVLTVASREIQVQEWEDKPTGIGEPLVQVDSTLMEPLASMPPEDETPLPPPQPFMPTPLPFAAPGMGFGSLGAPATMAAPTAPYPPLAIPTPVPMASPFAPAPARMPPGFPGGFVPPASGPPLGYGAQVQPQMGQPFAPAHETAFAGGPQIANPSGGLYDPVGSMQFPQERTYSFEARRRKRLLVIGVGIAVAVAATLAIVLLVGGHKSTAGNDSALATPSGSGTVARPNGSGEASGATAAVATPTPGSAVSPTPAPVTAPVDAAVTSTACSVELTTTPAGAQVAREDGTPLGTTPGTFDVPCGSEMKLIVRKQAYYTSSRVITATEPHTVVAIALAKALFSLKVTSMPPGATITVSGKTVGVTPTTIKVPAYQATNITLSKEGFTTDTQKLTIKQNNMAHFVALKRALRH